MATLAEILQRRFPNLVWTIEGDHYELLTVENGPKPTKAELLALAPAVDAEIAADRIKQRQQTALLRDPEAILRGFEILSEAVAEIYKALPAAVRSTIPAGTAQRFQGLQAKLAELRSANTAAPAGRRQTRRKSARKTARKAARRGNPT